MLRNFGAPELLILLGIVVLVFGTAKLSGVGNALGNSVREFRKAVREDDDAPAAPATNGESKEVTQP